MRAIIIGAGKVGYSIAQMLSYEGHDVVVVEKDEDRQAIVADTLDVQTFAGSGANIQVLEEAGVEQADLLVAVTEADELNMVACLLAKKYGVKRTVARVRNPEYAENAHKGRDKMSLGIDLIINPERVTAKEIAKLLDVPEAINVEYYADGQVQLLELKLTEECPAIGKSLIGINFRKPALIVAILRKGELIIPRGADVLTKGDIVFVVSRVEDMLDVEKALGKKRDKIESVMILGGGRIGYYLAKILERKKIKVKIIERDRQKCRELSKKLDSTLVLNGDGTDIDLLKTEGAGEVDSFVAVTGDDKLNLLVSLLAKHLGVKNSITQIRRSDYIPLVEQVGIDIVVSPRALTASHILKFIRPSEIVSVSFLGGAKAETLEIRVSEQFKAANKKLKDINFPKRAIIGAVLRGGQVFVPTGEDMIIPGDRVMVFALADSVNKVEDFFGISKWGV